MLLRACGLSFSTIVKKPKMELTIRTPYNTVVQNFEGFQRLITKTTEGVMIIQNRTPPAMHLLPPGSLRIKFSGEQKNLSGDYLHSGGWLFVHADNTCEVNVTDLFERKDVKVDQIDKYEVKDSESLAGKYASKARKATSKIFAKRASS